MKHPISASRHPYKAGRFIALSAAALLLCACAASNDAHVGDPVDNLQGQRATTERRLATAAADAIQFAVTDPPLMGEGGSALMMVRSPSRTEIGPSRPAFQSSSCPKVPSSAVAMAPSVPAREALPMPSIWGWASRRSKVN